MVKKIFIKRDVVDGLLTYSKSAYPEEGILLIRGKVKKNDITITQLVIPPFATHGEAFSSFPLITLPADSSILGVAHSHPSGVLRPSTDDITYMYGRLMIIIGYPFESERNMAIFDKDGNLAAYEIV